MKDDCSKHPENFNGLTPSEFAQGFVKTNYFYQRECFKEIVKEYNREYDGDKKRGRVQLSSGLEKISEAIKGSVMEAINDICNACKKYMKNPYKDI